MVLDLLFTRRISVDLMANLGIAGPENLPAARIGSSREAVSRCLNVLTTKMIVKEADGNILIARNGLDRLKQRERI